MKYTIEETYIYKVEADSPEEAQESFDEYWQAEDKEQEDYTGLEFLQNTLTIRDAEGKEVS
jgi:hypothetical protein|tara:strand:+ start:785 stop:967 length:183 start_codon:yes stop_codon:yes gene_type:complete